MSDGLNINGIQQNLDGVSIKKEDFSEKSKKYFNIFNNGGLTGDKDLNQDELSLLLGTLKEMAGDDGKLDKKDLKKSEFFEEMDDTYRGVNKKDFLNFANELLLKVQNRSNEIKANKENSEAKQREDYLKEQKGYIEKFNLYDYSLQENTKLEGPYLQLKEELAKENPDMGKVKELRTSLDNATDEINKARDEKTNAEKKLASDRNANLQNRPEMEPALKAKRSYSDSTNRIGGKAWKNNVGDNFGEGKLNVADYTSAIEVLDALLATESYKDLKLSDKAKEALLKDFIHNNKSMFNGDGKIHKNADVSKMELPKKSDIEKAKYGEPATNMKKEPKPLFTKKVQDIIADMAKNKIDGTSEHINDGWYQISWDDKDMAISYCKLDKGVYRVDLNHPDDVNEVYYSGEIDLNGDKTKMSDVELSILENVITIISEPINRAKKHKVI